MILVSFKHFDSQLYRTITLIFLDIRDRKPISLFALIDLLMLWLIFSPFCIISAYSHWIDRNWGKFFSSTFGRGTQTKSMIVLTYAYADFCCLCFIEDYVPFVSRILCTQFKKITFPLWNKWMEFTPKKYFYFCKLILTSSLGGNEGVGPDNVSAAWKMLEHLNIVSSFSPVLYCL